ncbi:MAG: FkbM family methyltransferase [Acidithiobacillus sp.]|nr:FkbM family methyltransferase [Acidithiobacillus sp.]
MEIDQKLAVQMRLDVARSLAQSALQDPETEAILWDEVPSWRSQLGKAWQGNDFVGEFDHGTKIQVNPADHIESQAFLHEMQEGDRGLIRYLCRYWEKNSNITFLDVGANVGLYSLMAAKRLTNGSIFSFEPVPSLYARLRGNVELNCFDNIKTFNIALADRQETSRIWVPKHSNKGMSSLFREDAESDFFPCEVMSMDYWRSISPEVTQVDMIKIDVEGAELKVIKGGMSTLLEQRPIVALELSAQHLGRAGTSISNVSDLLHALNYTAHLVSIDGRLSPAAEVAWQAHQNAVFIPHEIANKATA